MHELDHVRGGSSETLANLAGIAADLNVSASMDANQDKINSYKPAFGDGRDAVTQLENEQLLGQNDETLGDKLAENPDGFDYKTSTIQDIKYALTYFSPGARQAYEKIDASQEQAFLKGQKKAVDEFGQSIINAPDDIKALYQAAKENPTAVAIEILKSLKDIPKEYYDKGVTIVGTSFIGDSDDDFYNAGKASTELGLEGVTAIVSAGGAVVVKKTAGKVTGIEFKFPKRKPNRSDTNGTHDTGTGKNANNPFQPPEHPDFPITSYVVPDEGLTVNMAIHERQINPDTGQLDLNRIGGFTTKNEILNVEQVHSDLAVKSPDWGPEKTHVQKIQIKPGTRVQESVVGPQTGSDGKVYEGGGNQVEPLIDLDRSERSDFMVPVGTAIPLPKR